MQQQKVLIQAERLQESLEKFSTFGRTPANGVTRLSLSKEDIAARDYFVACCKEIGMEVKFDDMANIYAVMPGTENKPPVVMGSHLDTVKKGGRFDGVLGVAAALEVARTLHDNHIKPKAPFMIVNFTNEEGARFEPAMMCSGVISGKFDQSVMLKSRDEDGISFGEALAASGYAGDAKNRLKEASAFLEMHIEQGPVLESEGKQIGVVEGVVGMVNYEIEVTGESDHAGTTPMGMRKDALFTAADIISILRKQLNQLDPALVYTMGRMNVYPNIHTVIPNKAVFTLEARHQDPEVVAQVVEAIKTLPQEMSGCTISSKKLWSRETVVFDKSIVSQLEKSAQSLGLSSKKMYSGAGHDAQFMASYLPTAMLFVPSINGKSHCEEERTTYEDCACGVNVALDTVLALLEKV
ncbi:Zn-dependent hydrolase [Heyndrickxia coagulans]|uniref:Zn-dependent hydrolase n=1 Tax=Heyndrickxia coagulans TaxID=1398 RepID=A0AAW7CM96_HEYCO|nr:Zn-dependent hydrolase [Heyndrickxia coagulans]MDL5041979.1 Zn-dependent hydrolase [Heyndrickxia coagulans]